MAATPLLGLSLPADGTTNWGTLVNTSITALLDSAVAGTTTISSTTTPYILADTTEATNEARQAVILCTGARAGVQTIVAPQRSKTYVVINATTGSQAVKIAGTGPTTGVTVPNGKVFMVAWNGSDFVAIGGGVVNLATDVTGTLPIANGGTGQTTYTDGQLLIGNSTGNTLTKTTLTASTGISVTNGTGSITITNTAPDQTVSLTGAGATTTSGTYPNFTISSVNTTYSTATTTVNGLIKLGDGTVQATAANTVSSDASRTYAIQLNGTGQAVVNVPWASGSGTVTSVGATAPITSSGGTTPTIGLGVVPVANGGTNITSYTINGVLYASGTGTLASSSGFIFNGTNIGMGETTPLTKLHVTEDDSTLATLQNTDGSSSLINFMNDSGGTQGYVSCGSYQTSFVIQTNGVSRTSVDASGNLQMQAGAVMQYQPAHVSISSATTLTNANIQSRIIITSGTSYTITMPTGSTLNTLVPWAANNISYDFCVINNASGTITIDANAGVTILGNIFISTGVSAQFRISRTGAGSYTMYRLS
jgi:hypothetical protein